MSQLSIIFVYIAEAQCPKFYHYRWLKHTKAIVMPLKNTWFFFTKQSD